MNLLFDFAEPATGNTLIGKREEIGQLVSAIVDKRRGAVIYGSPKSGKETVVRNALATLKERNFSFALCEIDLFNVRTRAEFTECFRKAVTKCFNDVNRNTLLPFSIDFNSIPEGKILDVPQLLSEESGKKIIIYIKEFQNLAFIDDPEFKLEDLDRIWTKQSGVRYILTGSSVNVMKHIFDEKKLFYYMTVPITLKPVDKRVAVDYIVSSCLNVGRVVGEAEAEEMYNVTGGSIWYIKQLCTYCYAFPVGYITMPAVKQAVKALISNNMPHFLQTMLDLTPNQINFLRAALDGVQRFSSQEVLDTYHLNSSANVFRLKDALRKKEVLTFDRDDSAVILDPLFEYWLRNYYFKQSGK